MKKLTLLLLVALLVLSAAACKSRSENPSDSGSTGAGQSVGNQNAKTALEILVRVWDSYEDDEKFSIVGGDLSEENMTTDAPGKFNVEASAELDSRLGFPAALNAKIDGAAAIVHMFNSNTFTCGAFHVKSSGDVADLCASIRENITQRHWMCGFPEKLVVVTVGDCVVSFFGRGALVDAFKAKLSAAYPSAQVFCEEPLV